MTKIKVQAQHLQPGDIVGSGEKVLQITIASINLSSKKVRICLEKDDRARRIEWGKYTQITVERAE